MFHVFNWTNDDHNQLFPPSLHSIAMPIQATKRLSLFWLFGRLLYKHGVLVVFFIKDRISVKSKHKSCDYEGSRNSLKVNFTKLKNTVNCRQSCRFPQCRVSWSWALLTWCRVRRRITWVRLVQRRAQVETAWNSIGTLQQWHIWHGQHPRLWLQLLHEWLWRWKHFVWQACQQLWLVLPCLPGELFYFGIMF